MTKVYVEHSWRGPQEMDLDQALTPDHSDSNDSVSRAADDAHTGLKALGKLSALLVEKGVLTLEEAAGAMGTYPVPSFVKPDNFGG